MEVVVIAVGWVVYQQVRRITADDEALARSNAEWLLDVEEQLGVAVEQSINVAFASLEVLPRLANWQYLMHFPVTIGVALWLFVRHRGTAYVTFRNAVVLVTLLGVGIHLLFPLAPPRLMPGFIDVSVTVGPNPYSIPGSEQANQFAAMPSMHVAWALLVAWIVWRVSDRRWVRLIAAAHAAVTCVVVVVTGHHYVADIAVALVLATFAAMVAARTGRAAHRSRVDSRGAADGTPSLDEGATGSVDHRRSGTAGDRFVRTGQQPATS